MHLKELLQRIGNRIPRDRLYQMAPELKKYNVCDWIHYIKFGDQTYTRKTIYKTKYFEVKIVCWRPGQSTIMHSHMPRGCLMKVLWGSLQEDVYHIPTGTTKDINHTRGDIGYIGGDDYYHRLRALEDTVSIHIYSHII